MAQQIADEMAELSEIDGVTEVKDSCEGGIAFVLMCEDYNVQRVHVALLRSDKWTPRENFKNDASPSDSYVKATYHADYLN